MAARKHAVLSASSSHRWLSCTPSARLEQEFENRETEAAAEGTAAHALCKHKLRRALKMQSRRPVSQYDCEEMETCTDGYVQFVLETLAETKRHCADPIVSIEQRLDFSCYVPEGFGTGDCVIIADHTLHIIDFKYGQGVLVEAENNPQMMLYALGALHAYDALYDVDEVAMTIYQPRRENISTWTISVDALKAWAKEVLTPPSKAGIRRKGRLPPRRMVRFLQGGGQMPRPGGGKAGAGTVRICAASHSFGFGDRGHSWSAGRPDPMGGGNQSLCSGRGGESRKAVARL